MTKKFEAMEMTLTDLNNKIKSLSEKTSSVAAVDVLKPAVIETPKAKKSVVPVDYEIVPENTPKTLCMYEGCETKYFIPTKYYTNFCSDKCRNAEHKRKEDIRQAEKKALEDKARQWLDINKALVKRLGGNPHLITTTNKWLSVHDYCLNNTQEMEKGEYVFFIKRPASTFTIPKKNIGTFSVRHDPNSIPLLQRLREAWENEVIVYAAQTETKYIFIIDEPRDRIRSRDLISNVEYLDKTAKARLLDGRDVLPLDLNEFFSNKEIGK
jgi:hypothetical protein